MSLARKLGVGLAGLVVVGGVGLGGYLAFAVATAESRLSFPDVPMPQVAASTDPAVIARGRYLVYGPAHCQQCHGVDDRNAFAELAQEGPLSGGLEFAMGPIGTTWAANLTPDPETGIGALTDGALARAIRSGVMHDGSLSMMMTFSSARLSDEDLVAVISFLRSQPPVRREVPRGEVGLLMKALLPVTPLSPRTQAPRHVPESDTPSVERGEYLVEHAAMCADCHSPFDMATFQPMEPHLGGSQPDPSHGDDTDYEYVAPNLTSSAAGLTGRLSEEQFVDRIRQGRVHTSSIMPWENLQRATDADLRSIYRYLRTVPASDNDPGPSRRKKGWKPGDPVE
ncbi:cytochrome c [Myxococcota bacterium]|nr:cytochrome c [Myxococcota bacterium]